MNRPKAPLGAVRIADFTIHAAGPFCTQLLSQLGGECIKIESKTRLDAFRKPHAVYGRMSAATFDQVSVNKLSVRLNLKQPEAVALAKRLVSISDVAAESFRAGVMKRLGLGFDDLRAVKPDIILLSLSSCGQSGPDSHFAGYAPLVRRVGRARLDDRLQPMALPWKCAMSWTTPPVSMLPWPRWRLCISAAAPARLSTSMWRRAKSPAR